MHTNTDHNQGPVRVKLIKRILYLRPTPLFDFLFFRSHTVFESLGRKSSLSSPTSSKDPEKSEVGTSAKNKVLIHGHTKGPRFIPLATYPK